jgi:osmoprotectant transport system ATP-binding protein
VEHPVAVFSVRGAVKRYDGRAVLGPIDLEVPAGQTVAVIGPSGCGKSTLLRLLLGLALPDEGEVAFEGAPPSRAARLRLGTVIQEGGLFPHLTAEANASLMARRGGWPAARVRARLDELAALTGFPADGLPRYPAQLSGGQRQRVALMRALFLDPQALLLDEPLGALDPIVRADLQDELRGIFRSLGKTVVLVTHDLGEAGYLAGRLVLLAEGRVVQDGALGDLVERPASPFVTRFVRAQRTLAGLV